MAEISASLVKALRDKTNAGMMDCKKALMETGGDIEAAVDWLRKKGLSAAAKRSGRVAYEGLVGLSVEGTRGAVVEVNSETDFVARNTLFREFVAAVAALARTGDGELEALKAAVLPASGRTVADEVTHLAATIGENITLRRVETVSVGDGLVASYMHSAPAPGIGRIGVLVALQAAKGGEALSDLGKKLAMHVAAANPMAIDRSELPADALERERAVLSEQARASGKPEAVIQKMVEGRLGKFYEEVCLLEQAFVMDPQTKVSALLEAAGKELGAPVSVSRFVRFALGDGLEKQQDESAAA
ncbi:MAG TPA: translation elongation factor Ts [Rhodospirillales bacterium]|nr:translation elongation factor Ts [Rhodospirillales bacterium]